MMTLRPLHEALAAAVVARAFDLAFPDDGCQESTVRLDDALLASPSVEAAIAHVGRPRSQESWKAIITRLAVSLARDVAKLWSTAYPDRAEPLRAVEAAEIWAACPCDEHVEAAAHASHEATRQAMMVWRLEPKTAAWAGRTAAWAADAPKYGWQAIAAVAGACRATSTENVIGVAARFFAEELRDE